jgi:exodeoxyribonuclease VII large subunit
MASININSNIKIYSVSEINKKIRYILESNYSNIWIQGEISNYKQISSGHCYFRLKDDYSVLSAVMFKNSANQIKFNPEDGLEVICFGRISLYEPNGQHQIIVERMEPVGIGAAQLALKQLIEKLKKEGLLDLPKKPIPMYQKE